MQTKFFLLLTISLLGFCQIASAQAQRPAGTLDTSFGTEGKLSVRPSYESKLTAIAAQPDGKIVVAGSSGYKLTLMRLNRDGTADVSFAGSGILRTQYDSVYATRSALLIQPDGKILVNIIEDSRPVGQSSADFVIARFNADGSPDTSFSLDGKATADFSGAKDTSQMMALQADGKIVVAGTSNANFALVRFDADGNLDTTFNGSGKVVTNFPVPYQFITAMTVQSDGKILVAGTGETNKNQDIMLARYNSDGSLDSSFGKEGRILTDLGTYETSKALMMQADGSFLVAGSKKNGVLEYYESDIFIVKYHPDGSLDDKFGDAGKVITSFGKYEDIYSAILQADGKIVVAGTSGAGNPLMIYTLSDFLAVRYNADGTFDKDFGDNGKITTDFGRVEIAKDVALDKDGNILLAGYTGDWTFDGFEQSDFAIARYIGIIPKPLPDFALSTSATTINATRGSKIKLPIQVDHLNGFTGSIAITAPDTSSLKIVIPEPVQTATDTDAIFKLKVKKGTPAGSHQLVFTGKDVSGKEHSITITIVIQ